MKELKRFSEEGDSHEGGKNRDEVHEHPGPTRTNHLDAGDEADLRKDCLLYTFDPADEGLG